MPLNDYQLGGTIVVRGAKFAARQLGRVWRMSTKVWQGFRKIAQFGARALSYAFQRAGVAAIALTGILGGATKVYADFTLQMAKVGTLLDDGRSAMRRFGGEVRRLSMTTGQSTEVVADGLFQAISAGISDKDAAKFMGVAAQASVGGFTELNVAVDGLTNVLNAYGLSANEARAVSDAFFTANKFGKTTFQELAATIGTVAPTASALGSSYSDVLASVISITKAGVSTNQTMTQLSAIMTSTLNAVPKLTKAAGEQLGLVFGPDSIRHYGGIIPFMEAVEKATGGNLKTLKQLFPSVEALRGVLRLTSKTGLYEAKEGLRQIALNAGITEEKFAEVSETLGHQMKQLKQIGVDAFRSLGAALVKGFGIDLKKLVKKLRDGLPAFEAAATDFFSGLKAGFVDTWPEVRREWGRAMTAMGSAGETLFKALDAGFSGNNRTAKSWGTTIGTVIGKALADFGKLVAKIDTLTTALVTAGKQLGVTVKGFYAAAAAVTPGLKGPVNPADAASAKTGAVNLNDVAKEVLRKRFRFLRQGVGSSDQALEAMAAKAAQGKLSAADFPYQMRQLPWYAKDLGGQPAGDVARAVNMEVQRAIGGQTGKFAGSIGSVNTDPMQHPDPRVRAAARERQLVTGRAALKEWQKTAVQKGRGLLESGRGLVQGPGVILDALGRTIADAVGERPWELFFKVDSKTEVDNGDGNLDMGGGGSGSVDHHERGAGSAIAEFRMRQKYLVTEGAIRSVPLEFTTVKGSGAGGAMLG